MDRKTTNAELDPQVRRRVDAIWKRAYSAKRRDDVLALYADWAGTYDEDHRAIGFFGHVRASQLAAKYTAGRALAPVLDVGAGTGAAGVELSKLGFENLTAVDLSPAMLQVAEGKGVYRHLVEADLDWPLDVFPTAYFDAAVAVGAFSYGQAPAHALDELVRVVRPGGVVVFTLRVDFHETDAMGVRTKMGALEAAGAWHPVEISPPEKYLPRKDPDVMFRTFCYRVRERADANPDKGFAEAVRRVFTSNAKVRRLDHRYIWDSTASRLYDRYTECPDYYLTDAEEAILRANARAIVGGARQIVELGCGSARKATHVLRAALEADGSSPITYLPIDVSEAALASTRADVEREFGGKVTVKPLWGRFRDALPGVPQAEEGQLVLFFGSSLGNLETLQETVELLSVIQGSMGPADRLVVGLDLHKDEAILRRAYEAGPKNRAFFVNMLRRINAEFNANLDLAHFRQESTYDEGEPYGGIKNRSVNFKLVTTKAQAVYLGKLDLEAHLEAGDAIQVGTSRKFEPEDIGRLLELGGFVLTRQWVDERRYFSLSEAVVDTQMASRAGDRDRRG